MNTARKIITAMALAGTVAGAASPALAGGTYRFTVHCQDRTGIAEWRTGDIDPGQEYLRVATGTNNPGCSVADYSDRDSWAPVTVYEGAVGVVEGVPLLGQVLENVFGW